MRNGSEMNANYIKWVDNLYKFIATEQEALDYLEAAYQLGDIKGNTFYDQIIEYVGRHPYAKHEAFKKQKEMIVKACKRKRKTNNWFLRNDFLNLKWLIALAVSVASFFIGK